MTNEQINIALAKWHNDKWPEGWVDFTHGRIFTRVIDDSCSVSHRPYTDSLDTMRKIEDLLTMEQRYLCWAKIEMAFMATAEQRARAAVKVLGLEVGE